MQIQYQKEALIETLTEIEKASLRQVYEPDYQVEFTEKGMIVTKGSYTKAYSNKTLVRHLRAFKVKGIDEPSSHKKG